MLVMIGLMLKAVRIVWLSGNLIRVEILETLLLVGSGALYLVIVVWRVKQCADTN